MNITQESINARNTLNTKADQIESVLLHLMPEFLHKKVWKTSGSGGQSAAFAKAVQQCCSDNRIGGPESRYSLILRSDVTGIWAELVFRADMGCVRETFRIGTRDDQGVLKELETGLTYPEGRPQFELEAVKGKFRKAHELEREARLLRNEIMVFSRH